MAQVPEGPVRPEENAPEVSLRLIQAKEKGILRDYSNRSARRWFRNPYHLTIFYHFFPTPSRSRSPMAEQDIPYAIFHHPAIKHRNDAVADFMDPMPVMAGNNEGRAPFSAGLQSTCLDLLRAGSIHTGGRLIQKQEHWVAAPAWRQGPPAGLHPRRADTRSGRQILQREGLPVTGRLSRLRHEGIG